MPYTFYGNLRGFLCDECFEAIAGQTVLLYLPQENANVTAAAVADAKDTFHLVSAAEQRSRSQLLIAQTTTDSEGNFAFELDEKHGSTAFDIDFTCGNEPFHKPKHGDGPLQFHITTIYPQWRGGREQENRLYFKWQYSVSSKWWCYIKGYYFDIWTICGRLINCDTKVPLPGAIVTAFDADLITDDLLGSAVTDANGFFKIIYHSADFRKNFIPFNLETDIEYPFIS